MSVRDGTEPTVQQAEKFLQLVKAGGVIAAKTGIGSNGYPATPGMLVLYDSSTVWIDPDGTMRGG